MHACVLWIPSSFLKSQLHLEKREMGYRVDCPYSDCEAVSVDVATSESGAQSSLRAHSPEAVESEVLRVRRLQTGKVTT